MGLTFLVYGGGRCSVGRRIGARLRLMSLGLYARLQNAWDALRMKAGEEGGANSVEYGLAIAAVIAAGVIVVALIVT